MTAPSRVIKGTYRLLELLASDALSETHVARSLVQDDIVEIVIVPAKEKAADELRARLRREAETLRMITSRNVIGFVDYGVDEDVHFLVTHYTPGCHLDALLSAVGRLKPELALGVARQAASALEALSAAAVVHRCIRPEAVLVSHDGVAKLTRFRVAKRRGAAAITQVGFLPYEVSVYTSPEQLDGESDSRSDIYGFGVTLYQLLVGKPPFQTTDPIALSMAIEKTLPAAPSKTCRDVPTPVDDIVLCCMAKDPKERYQAPEMLREAIEQISAMASEADIAIALAELRSRARRSVVRESDERGAGEVRGMASLLSPDGSRISLQGPVVRIGRVDRRRQEQPDIDLTGDDPGHVVSRSHAQLREQGGLWFVYHEPKARNPTFVNERPVRAGEMIPLRNGDRIGFAGVVEFTFEEA